MYTGIFTPTGSDLTRLDGGAVADMFQYNNWEGIEKEGKEKKRSTEQIKKKTNGDPSNTQIETFDARAQARG